MALAALPMLAAAPLGVWVVLWDILVLLAMALVLGRLPSGWAKSGIVGYSIAGMLVGTNVLGWISAQERWRQHINSICQRSSGMRAATLGKLEREREAATAVEPLLNLQSELPLSQNFRQCYRSDWVFLLGEPSAIDLIHQGP